MRTVSLKLLAAVLMLSCPAVAQDRPLVEDLGVGSTEAPKKVSFPYDPLPTDQWVGEEFIFLPQSMRYPLCRKQGQPESKSLAYNEAVGRIGVVQKLEVAKLVKTTIHLKMKDTGEILTCTTYSDSKQISFMGLGLVKDIVLARKRYEGNSYYANQRIFYTYDPSTDKWGKLEVKRFSPLKVAKVSAGTQAHSPVRVVVETEDGRQGFFEMPFSGTNNTMDTFLGFDFYLLEKDPHTQHKWSKKVWKAIEEGYVLIGMTEAQMKMAMPSPISVTTNVSKRGEISIWRFYKLTVTTFRGKVESATVHSTRQRIP